MTHGLRSRTLLVLASGILLVAVASAGPASASNMAFKLNKQIWAFGSGAKGQNLLSLPDVNPYTVSGGMTALCNALNLDSSGQLIQIDPDTGTVTTYTCGQVETFTLNPQYGILIHDSIDTGGVVVGADTPGNSYPIYILGSGAKGLNLFPVEYHTTAVTPEDICQQCGLDSSATVTHIDAQTGTVFSHTCGTIAVSNLVLGEAALIQETTQSLTCTPSHF